MSVNNVGKSPDSSHWTPYAYVTWSGRGQNWIAAQSLKGPKGKAKSKGFSTDMAAAVYVAEQAVRVGYVHPRVSCLPTASGRASDNMYPFDASRWVRFLFCSFFFVCKNSSSPNLFQSKTPGLYGPLNEAQVQVLLPDHEGGGITFHCSPKVLKELGMPSVSCPTSDIFARHLNGIRRSPATLAVPFLAAVQKRIWSHT
jgi:hypothetical protein